LIFNFVRNVPSQFREFFIFLSLFWFCHDYGILAVTVAYIYLMVGGKRWSSNKWNRDEHFKLLRQKISVELSNSNFATNEQSLAFNAFIVWEICTCDFDHEQLAWAV